MKVWLDFYLFITKDYDLHVFYKSKIMNKEFLCPLIKSTITKKNNHGKSKEKHSRKSTIGSVCLFHTSYSSFVYNTFNVILVALNTLSVVVIVCNH